MKKCIKLTALLMAAIIMLCACDPNALNKNETEQNGNDLKSEGTLTFKCSAYEGASIYELSIQNEKDGFGYGFRTLNYTHETEIEAGTYKVTAHAYSKEGNLLAKATPKDLVIEKGKHTHYSFDANAWTEYTAPEMQVETRVRVENGSDYDSSAIFMGDKYIGKDNEDLKLSLANNRFHEIEIFGFKNGNPLGYLRSRLFPHEDSLACHVFEPYSKINGRLTVSHCEHKDASSYVYMLDGHMFKDSIKNISIKPGDHHLEIYAMKEEQIIAAKYFDFNIESGIHKEINIDAWENTLNEETISNVVYSFNTASWGYNRVYNYPLNRLTVEQVAGLEGALNANIDKLLDGAEKIENIKCTVENGTYTATLKFKYTNSSGTTITTMTVEQSPFGALRITRVNVMEDGTTYTDNMSYALLDDYSFKYAKNISDNITFVDNVTWEGNNQTETIVAAKIRNQAELSKLLQVNGFNPTGDDWDAYNKKYVQETSEGCYNIWITGKHTDGSYSVSIREFNR